MKLILENWNRYLEETKTVSCYGDLYLFEDNDIKKINFYDSFNSLTESEGDIQLFLENWEKSVEYQFNIIDEALSGGEKSLAPEELAIYQDMLKNPPGGTYTPEQQRIIDKVTAGDAKEDPILFLQTQAWLLLRKYKEKAVKSVSNTIKKITNATQDMSPTKKKVALTGLSALSAGVVAASMYAMSKGAIQPEAVADIVQGIAETAPEVAEAAIEAAESGSADAAAEVAESAIDAAAQIPEKLGNVQDETTQQMAQEMKNTLSGWESEFEEMFNAADAADAAADTAAGSGPPIELENVETPEDMKEWFNQAMEQAMEEEQAAREKKKAFDVRWDKETQKMQDYELEGELGMRPELSRAEIRDLRQYEKDFNNLMLNAEMPEIEGKSRQEIRGMLKDFDDEFYKKHFRKYIRQKNPRGAVRFIRKVLGK